MEGLLALLLRSALPSTFSNGLSIPMAIPAWKPLTRIPRWRRNDILRLSLLLILFGMDTSKTWAPLSRVRCKADLFSNRRAISRRLEKSAERETGILLCASRPVPICFNQIFFVLLSCLVPLKEAANASSNSVRCTNGALRCALTTKDNYTPIHQRTFDGTL